MSAEAALLEDLASLASRPFDFVMWAFPWGEAGTELADRAGPEAWQRRVLEDLQSAFERSPRDGAFALREAYQIAIKSGHDIGKTALLCWLIWWGMSTREDTRGRATANTEKQLSRILWSELSKWHRLFIARAFFKVTATALHSADPEREKTWRIDAIPWSEDNTQAFAGLHNYGKRIILIFDEASTIHDGIWEVVDGVTHEADTEILWVATGNPTRNYGRFHDCFTRFSDTWRCYTVDSRAVSFTNKERIERAIAQWGADSDYVKVRFLGEFPDASSTQLIPIETINSAMARPAIAYPYEPLILALDVARYGDNESVAAFRRGKDARSLPAARWRGLSTIETGQRLVSMMALHRPDATFIDEGGVGGGVVDYIRHLGHHVVGVQFGGKPSTFPMGVRVANKRTEMFIELRDWLREGGAIEDDQDLREQLVAIEYYHQKKTDLMLLTPKEEMDTSPDWADALAMTFAFPVAKQAFGGKRQVAMDYDPFSHEALLEGVG